MIQQIDRFCLSRPRGCDHLYSVSKAILAPPAWAIVYIESHCWCQQTKRGHPSPQNQFTHYSYAGCHDRTLASRRVIERTAAPALSARHTRPRPPPAGCTRRHCRQHAATAHAVPHAPLYSMRCSSIHVVKGRGSVPREARLKATPERFLVEVAADEYNPALPLVPLRPWRSLRPGENHMNPMENKHVGFPLDSDDPLEPE